MRRISGTTEKGSNSPTDRVIDKLCELHILEKIPRNGKTRYDYIAPSYVKSLAKNGMSDADFRLFWEGPNQQSLRLRFKPMIEGLKQVANRSLGKDAPDGWGVETMPMGILIGRQPPKCFIDYIRVFEDLMLESWNYTVGRALWRDGPPSNEELAELDRIERDAILRAAAHIKLGMTKSPRSSDGTDEIRDEYEDVMQMADGAIGELARIERTITPSDIDDWNSYMDSTFSDTRKGHRNSLIIGAIDPYDYVEIGLRFLHSPKCHCAKCEAMK